MNLYTISTPQSKTLLRKSYLPSVKWSTFPYTSLNTASKSISAVIMVVVMLKGRLLGDSHGEASESKALSSPVTSIVTQGSLHPVQTIA